MFLCNCFGRFLLSELELIAKGGLWIGINLNRLLLMLRLSNWGSDVGSTREVDGFQPPLKKLNETKKLFKIVKKIPSLPNKKSWTEVILIFLPYPKNHFFLQYFSSCSAEVPASCGSFIRTVINITWIINSVATDI